MLGILAHHNGGPAGPGRPPQRPGPEPFGGPQLFEGPPEGLMTV